MSYRFYIDVDNKKQMQLWNSCSVSTENQYVTHQQFYQQSYQANKSLFNWTQHREDTLNSRKEHVTGRWKLKIICAGLRKSGWGIREWVIRSAHIQWLWRVEKEPYCIFPTVLGNRCRTVEHQLFENSALTCADFMGRIIEL